MKRIFLPFLALSLASPLLSYESPIQTNFMHFHNQMQDEFQELYQMGLDAMSQEDYIRAKATFSSILRHQRAFLKENREFYFSTKIKLAVCESNLGNFIEADQVLNKLRKENPPEKALIMIECFRARLRHKKGQAKEAFLIFYNLEKQTQSNLWEQEDLIFFQDLEAKLNHHYLSILQRLQRLESNALSDEATPIYESLLKAIERGHFPQELRNPQRKNTLLFNLANLYYQQQKYTQTLHTLSRLESLDENDSKEASYLQALCHLQVNETEKAKALLEDYLSNPKLPRSLQAHLHLGKLYFKEEAFAKALHHLKAFSKSPPSEESFQAKLTLSKIYLQQQDLEEMGRINNELKLSVPSNSPLNFELAYLNGERAFLLKNYSQAIEFYESALPLHNKQQAQWYPSTLYNLAWCYLEMGRLATTPSDQKQSFWSKAKTLLSELVTFQKSPEAALALARLYLIQGEDQEKIEELLTDTNFISSEQEAESLYLRARASNDKALQARLFETLTDESFQDSPFHSLAWYFQGTQLFQEAQKSLISNESEDQQNKKRLEKSIHFLTKAYKLLKGKDNPKAFLAIKYALYAYHYLDTKVAKYQILSWIKKLFERDDYLLEGQSALDEIWYLQAATASSLLDEEANQPFLQSIEEAKDQLLTHTPNSPYTDKVLYLLGMVYYQKKNYSQAQENLQPLVKNYPSSPHRAEGLYWLAEVLEWQDKTPETISELRKEVFTHYPNTSFAPEAYFHYYSFNDYLQGEAKAFGHLEKMKALFPHSPLNIVGDYLIGLQYQQEQLGNNAQVLRSRDLNKAFSSFQSSKDLFLEKLPNIPPHSLSYFSDIYFKSLSELPHIKNIQALQAQGSEQRILQEQATELYQVLIHEIEDPSSIFSKYVKTAPEFLPQSHSLLEQSYYQLAKLYLQTFREDEAQPLLEKLMLQLQATGNTKGYYPSRTWFQMGKIHETRQEHDKALHCFLEAEKAAQAPRSLSTEKRLDLWLHIARSHERLGNYDLAMRQLSEVINEFSSSEKRIEAMYLRALIYEQQGKREFALKQLESTSKNQGKWAEIALEKLRQDYGF